MPAAVFRKIVCNPRRRHERLGDAMSEDLDSRWPKDRDYVDMHEAWERDYWCRQFDCTEAQLRHAVQQVGAMAKVVEAYLKA